MNVLATLALALAPALVHAPLGDEHDLIIRTDGKEVPCRVLLETDAKVVYRAKGRTQELARAEVSEVRSVERTLRDFLERFAKTDTRDLAGVTDLALLADSRGLTGEAHHSWIRVLTLDPTNEAAWTHLGGVKRSGKAISSGRCSEARMATSASRRFSSTVTRDSPSGKWRQAISTKRAFSSRASARPRPACAGKQSRTRLMVLPPTR